MTADALPTAVQDYPLLNLFWTILWISLWTVWLFLLFRVAIDIFSSHDLNGWGKAGWLIFVIVLPYLGVLVYLIARGGDMQARETTDVAASYGQVASAPQQPDGAATSNADELSKLAALHDRGVLTDAEFATQKATVLSR